MDSFLPKVEACLVNYVGSLMAEWTKFDSEKQTKNESVALATLVFTGLAEMQITADVFWGGERASVEAVVSGIWRNTLPFKVGECVPGWFGKVCRAQPSSKFKVRLLQFGLQAQSNPDFDVVEFVMERHEWKPPRIKTRLLEWPTPINSMMLDKINLSGKNFSKNSAFKKWLLKNYQTSPTAAQLRADCPKKFKNFLTSKPIRQQLKSLCTVEEFAALPEKKRGRKSVQKRNK